MSVATLASASVSTATVAVLPPTVAAVVVVNLLPSFAVNLIVAVYAVSASKFGVEVVSTSPADVDHLISVNSYLL